MTTQRLLPVFAASLALALTGCATDENTDAMLDAASPTTTQSADAESVGLVPADQQTPDADPADPGQGQPDTGTTAQAATDGTCSTEQLDIGLSNEQGAAGSRLADITFTNASSEPCTLNGFPGVSAVTNDDGTQLGAAAERETGQETAPVTLEPGHTASASLKMTNVGVLDPASCQPQAADGLRVYPPGETASAFIRVPGLEGCAGDAHYLSIQPVTAG
ncbi:DUF4232 domain-containing protein [Corynebacterium sp. B5-R-101]|uniref:DUF4232 domain-containing protein n=1 Tax=Corynebacterium intestinale TaxID=2943492 RepID=A0ABT0TCP2_9CORY|nr:DUF4232 domain-containing protein [Corynebacterium intestinale]MCL8494843.1 DUF4232 domain-containing protein [Corynebacterium intestinale]MCP1391079.1 DUF4232 domain-containing protein [Corynebacterium intestinale]